MLLRALLLAAGLASAADQDALRASVLAFARENLGQAVGNGECTALANLALKHAGAKVRPRKDSPKPGDYVWGEQVLLVEGVAGGSKLTGSIDDVRPGDIVQLRDAKFPKAHFSHHTAIVEAITPQRLTLLQENYRGERFVTRGTFRIDLLSEGWIRIYRPVPRRDSLRGE